MHGKKGMALMIAIGKKKHGDSSDDESDLSQSDRSLGGDEEDYSMELETMVKSFFEAGAKGRFGKAARMFTEMVKACAEDNGDNSDDEEG